MSYKTLDQLIADSEAYRKTWRGKLNIFWYNYIVKPITYVRYLPRKIKNRVQRARRGYGYQDLWSADTYMANMFAGILRELADNKHGVCYPYYNMHENVDEAFKIMQTDFRVKAELFSEYAKEGIAVDQEWKDQHGGLLEGEFKDLMTWFGDIFPSLWD